jgi:hypothetical protein
MIPYVGTQAWIAYLSLPLVDGWRPWFVDGQIAGLVSNILIFFDFFAFQYILAFKLFIYNRKNIILNYTSLFFIDSHRSIRLLKETA